jgi:hypothetical protein
VDESELHALAELIDAARRADPRWSSFDLLARRARARGHHVSRANLARIRNEHVKTFSAGQVLMLAAALDLPLTQVIRAYLEAMGLPYAEPRPASVESAVAADPRLSADDKTHLLALLDSMVDTAQQHVDPDPDPSADGVGDRSRGPAER